MWHACSLQKPLKSTLHLNLAQPTHKQEGQSAFPSSFPIKTNKTHVSCGQAAVAHRQPQKPVLLVCIAPAPRTMPGRDLTESLCRLRVLPVATRAAQLSPLNLNCSAPDSAAERTFSSPERALDSKARGRKLRPLPARVPPTGPSEGPAGLVSLPGSPCSCPCTHLAPRWPTQDRCGPDSCTGTATLSPSS